MSECDILHITLLAQCQILAKSMKFCNNCPQQGFSIEKVLLDIKPHSWEAYHTRLRQICRIQNLPQLAHLIFSKCVPDLCAMLSKSVVLYTYPSKLHNFPVFTMGINYIEQKSRLSLDLVLVCATCTSAFQKIAKAPSIFGVNSPAETVVCSGAGIHFAKRKIPLCHPIYTPSLNSLGWWWSTSSQQFLACNIL